MTHEPSLAESASSARPVSAPGDQPRSMSELAAVDGIGAKFCDKASAPADHLLGLAGPAAFGAGRASGEARACPSGVHPLDGWQR